MPAIWHTWPRYSWILSRCSERSIGSRRSTCLLAAIPLSRRGQDPSARRYIALARFCEGFPPRSRSNSGGSGLVGGSVERRAGAVLRLRSLLCLDDRRERRNLLALAQTHHDHALRRSAEALDVVDRDPDHGAAVRDQHHLVVVPDDARPDEMPAGLGQLHGLHTEAAAALARVVGELRPLAIA